MFSVTALSLQLIEDPDKLACGSFAATSTRTKDKMTKLALGTFHGSQYDWVMGKLNSHNARIAAPNGDVGTVVTDHIGKNTVASGCFNIKPGYGRVAAGCFQQSGSFLCNHIANTPSRHHRFKGHPNLTRKLKFLWRRFKRPYVQESIDVFLKGPSPRQAKISEFTKND